MNLLEKYKAMVQAQREATLSPVFDNATSTNKDSPTRIISNAIIPIDDGLKKQSGPAMSMDKPAVTGTVTWMPEIQSFIDWFMELEPPTEPFYLEPHRHVTDPKKCFDSLRQEIAVGARCPRNRNGALRFDLEILKKILH